MTWRKSGFFYCVLLLPALLLAAEPSGVPGQGLGEAMAGEFAFQSGRYREAAQYYLRAALVDEDPLVAERAARMAVLAGDESALAIVLARWQALQPNSIARAGLALRLALRQQRVSQARSEAEQLLALGSEGSHELRASLEDSRGPSVAPTRALLRELASSEALPDSFEAWINLAGLARKMGESASAGLMLKRMTGVFPKEPRASIALALWQGEQGDADGAAATLSRLQPAGVSRDEDRRQVAGEWLKLQRHAEAERWLATVAQDPATYRQRLALLAKEKDAAAVTALVRQISRDRGLSAGRRQLLLGLAEEIGPDWRAAERHYREVRNDPERVEARLRLAYVLQKQGRAGDALGLIRKMQIDASFKPENRRDAYALEAQILKSEPGQADIAAYSRGLQAFPDDSQLLYGRAMRHVEQGQVDEGLADLRRILDVEPSHAGALNAYGYTLAERKQRYGEALPYVEQALRLQPDSAAILDSLGYIRMRQDRHAEALPLLERAWSLRQDPEIAAHLGEIFWLLGRREEATRVWAQGLALDPGNREILALQEKLRP